MFVNAILYCIQKCCSRILNLSSLFFQSPETETRRPSAVWLRHLEKMEAVVAKQKQYEQELHLKKRNYGDLKLISDVRKTVNKIPPNQGPVVKRFKLSQNQENTTKFTELRPVPGARVSSEGPSNLSEPNSNGTLTKFAKKPQSKMAQKLQRQEERREKFIKKHEDLLNQVIILVQLVLLSY